MNFTHLAAFHAVAETGSVTAAAERMHISQPALTREIRELEERFGVPLFDRMPRGMQPTEAGRLLLEYARQIFHLADTAEATISEFAGLQRGQLMLASSRTGGIYVLPDLIDRFCDLYPKVTINLGIYNTEAVKQAVLSQECPLGLIEGEYDEEAFDAMACGSDEIIAIAGPGHPYAKRRRLTAEALGQTKLVLREAGSGTRRIVEQAYEARGLSLTPNVIIGGPEVIKRLLRLGRTVSWVSRMSVAEELAAGTLVELPVSDIRIARQLYMLWRKGYSLSPSARAFKAFMQQYIELKKAA